jgi:hypothetical protein
VGLYALLCADSGYFGLVTGRWMIQIVGILGVSYFNFYFLQSGKSEIVEQVNQFDPDSSILLLHFPNMIFHPAVEDSGSQPRHHYTPPQEIGAARPDLMCMNPAHHSSHQARFHRPCRNKDKAFKHMDWLAARASEIKAIRNLKEIDLTHAGFKLDHASWSMRCERIHL